jgi:hypothetical protein
MFKKLKEQFSTTVFDLEIETEIHGKNYIIYYDMTNDKIMIIKWDEFNEDIESFIDTSKIESFLGTRDLNAGEDCYDYATESVYQYVTPIDFDEYLSINGNDELIEHVNNELSVKGIKIIKPKNKLITWLQQIF